MDKHTPALQHVAVSENGELRWMTGRKPRECELYAMPDGGRLSPLYAAVPELLEALDSVLQSLQTGVPETIGYGEQTKKAFSEGWNAAMNAVYERAAAARAALAKARGEA